MAPKSMLLSLLAPALLFCGSVLADESHRGPPQVAEDADWATRHLAEEHHISNFDAGAFFSLHDFDNRGFWDLDDLYTTYGFKDESTNSISTALKTQAIEGVIKMIDKNGDKMISREEFLEFTENGGMLPELFHSIGHHGDDEYEYEIHHWEKFHDENTREEDLTHPEDIAHFAKHDKLEEEQERIEAIQKRNIVAENIPPMFRVKR